MKENTKLQVANYVKLGLLNETLFVGFGSIQIEVKDKDKQSEYLLVLKTWQEPHTVAEIHKKLGHLNYFDEVVTSLIQSNILFSQDTFQKSDRYSRQALYFSMHGQTPSEVQATLKSKKVLILGCGGIGNLVAANLATAGVGHLHFMDLDHIEASNLSRQFLFTEEDIGKDKALTLKEAIAKRNSSIQLTYESKKITSLSDLDGIQGYDLVVLSADAGGVISLVNKACIRLNVPYINVCYVNDIAVWGPFVIPQYSGCMDCQTIYSGPGTNPEWSSIIKEINQNYQAPSIGPVNMLSSSLASLDIFHFLAGNIKEIQSLNKRIGLWTHNLKFEEQNCSLSKKCKTCGTPNEPYLL